MLLKLGIIAGLVVLGGMVFYNELGMFFPSTLSTVPETLKSDVAHLGENATVFVSDRISESTVQLGHVADEAADGIIGNIKEVQQNVAMQAPSLNPFDSAAQHGADGGGGSEPPEGK